jgi:hypothetical protein
VSRAVSPAGRPARASARLQALALAGLLACGAAHGEEVARIDDVPVLARHIGLGAEPSTLPAAANALRQRAMKSALDWFVAEHKLAATAADLESYATWNEEFQRREKARRAQRLAVIEAELAKAGLAPARREQLLREREVFRQVAARDGDREAASRDPGSRQRVWGPWITSFKANRALYETYGGRVGLTKFGPEPIGALETLLREREKAGALRIFDEALAREFWAWYAVQPRRPAKPGEIDFTYYWLKPFDDLHGPRR